MPEAGWRAVEDIRPGDEVLSRSEHDPAATAEWKAVEARFERTGCILHLHAGGEVIRTTPEHPFFVEGKGWVQAGALRDGDRLATLSGEWVAVEEVFDTQTWEPVYNLRVADHHTYFVGDDGWGFAVWAHNFYEPLSGLRVAEEAMQSVNRPLTRDQLLSGSDPQARAITQAIREAGVYEGMGEHTKVAALVTYELWRQAETPPPGYTPDLTGVLRKYFDQQCIKDEMKAEERVLASSGPGRLGGKADVPAMPPLTAAETEIKQWTAYVYRQPAGARGLNESIKSYRDRTGIGNSDARGRSYETYISQDLQGQRPNKDTLHGHHIVYKGGGANMPVLNAQVRVAKDILLYHGINPYWDKENLCYGPNYGNKTHNEAQFQTVYTDLRDEFMGQNRKSRIIQILLDEANRWVSHNLANPP